MLFKRNLSEEVGYCDTSELEAIALKDQENAYYKAILKIIKKQKANEVVTNEEYAAIPIGSLGDNHSVAYGYFIVNFNYSRVVDEEKLIKFLSTIDFALLGDCEAINMHDKLAYKFRDKYSFDYNAHYDETLDKVVANIQDWEGWQALHFTDLELFITKILELVDPRLNNTKSCLDNIDRRICPAIFDNVLDYFRLKEDYYEAIVEKYKNKNSLTAYEVLNILGISRRTLTRYVTTNKIKAEKGVNGRYKYNKESVINLLK